MELRTLWLLSAVAGGGCFTGMIETMRGRHLETGLQNLKAQAEERARATDAPVAADSAAVALPTE